MDNSCFAFMHHETPTYHTNNYRKGKRESYIWLSFYLIRSHLESFTYLSRLQIQNHIIRTFMYLQPWGHETLRILVLQLIPCSVGFIKMKNKDKIRSNRVEKTLINKIILNHPNEKETNLLIIKEKGNAPFTWNLKFCHPTSLWDSS